MLNRSSLHIAFRNNKEFLLLAQMSQMSQMKAGGNLIYGDYFRYLREQLFIDEDMEQTLLYGFPCCVVS